MEARQRECPTVVPDGNGTAEAYINQKQKNGHFQESCVPSMPTFLKPHKGQNCYR